jgi:hypothetical protein
MENLIVARKESVDILATLSEDDEQRYLWQFILDTKTEEVEQELRKQLPMCLPVMSRSRVLDRLF